MTAMGARDTDGEELTIWVDPDGSVHVDVGSRYVAVGSDELERILDRLAADGGSVRLLGEPAARTTATNPRSTRATPPWAPPATSAPWRTSAASR